MAINKQFYFQPKSGYIFQYDLFDQGAVKNGTLRKEPFHDVYMIKGPSGEIQRVHYAMDDLGVRANVFSNHAQSRPYFNTSFITFESKGRPSNELFRDFLRNSFQSQEEKQTDFFNLEKQNFHLPGSAQANSSKSSTSSLSLNEAFSEENANSNLKMLPVKSLDFPSEKPVIKPINSKTQILSTPTDSSYFIITSPPSLDDFENVASNARVVSHSSISKLFEITTKDNDPDHSNEITVTESFIDTSSNIDAPVIQMDSQIQPVPIDDEKDDSTFTEAPSSSDIVNERESSPSSTFESFSLDATNTSRLMDHSIKNVVFTSTPTTQASITYLNSSLVVLNNSRDSYEYHGKLLGNVSTAATEPISQVSEEHKENISLISSAVYLRIPISQYEAFSDFQSSAVKTNESFEMQPSLLELVSENANDTADVMKFVKPEIVASETNYSSVETRSSGESRINNSRHTSEISTVSPDPENNIAVTHRLNKFSDFIPRDILMLNYTRLSERTLENLNVTRNDSGNSTNTENEIILTEINNDHENQSSQEITDKEKTFTYEISNDFSAIPNSIDKLMEVESTTDESHIEENKVLDISYEHQYALNKSNGTEDFLLPISKPSDSRIIKNYVSDPANKEELYSHKLRNSFKRNNAFLKLWRGKSGVRIQPFGVNGTYKMIPMYQGSENDFMLE
ncbi:uncharacterized protein NPIL_58951 [Nephila pilipes]|uniref:Uncharacterized protein n=1 Tax=Nephila pilipes TaxID=299642 RepID=A0A8X6PUI1_NEPPI|nr:uncharacterized protein NPIL_58951 [Nephila pilipes]